MAYDFAKNPKAIDVADHYNCDDLRDHLSYIGLPYFRHLIRRTDVATSVAVPSDLLAERVVLQLLEIEIPEGCSDIASFLRTESTVLLRAGLFEAYCDDVPMSRMSFRRAVSRVSDMFSDIVYAMRNVRRTEDRRAEWHKQMKAYLERF